MTWNQLFIPEVLISFKENLRLDTRNANSIQFVLGLFFFFFRTELENIYV